MSATAAFSESETSLLLEGSSSALGSLRDNLAALGPDASEEMVLVDRLATRVAASEKRQVEAILADSRRFADSKAWSEVPMAAQVRNVVARLAANRVAVLQTDAVARGRKLAPELVPLMSRETLAGYRSSLERMLAALERSFAAGTFRSGPGAEKDPELTRLRSDLAALVRNQTFAAGKASYTRRRAMLDPRFVRLESVGWGTERYKGGMVERMADALKADLCGFVETKAAIAACEKHAREIPGMIERRKTSIQNRMHAVAVRDYNAAVSTTKEVLASVDARLASVAAGTADPEAECRDRLLRLEIEAFDLRKRLLRLMNGRGETPETALVSRLVRFDRRSLGSGAAGRETVEDAEFRREVMGQIALLRSREMVRETGTDFETEIYAVGPAPAF